MRAFQDRSVKGQEIRDILSAAVYAPSAGDAQPWHFVVIDDPAILEMAARLNPHADWAIHAPAGILVCANLEDEKYDGFWVQDCAAVSQNILLLAHDKGLGATWTGVHPVKPRVDGFRSLFELPQNIVPHSLILLGYPSRKAQEVDRSIEGRVHQNIWHTERRSTAPSAIESRSTLKTLF